MRVCAVVTSSLKTNFVREYSTSKSGPVTADATVVNASAVNAAAVVAACGSSTFGFALRCVKCCTSLVSSAGLGATPVRSA